MIFIPGICLPLWLHGLLHGFLHKWNAKSPLGEQSPRHQKRAPRRGVSSEPSALQDIAARDVRGSTLEQSEPSASSSLSSLKHVSLLALDGLEVHIMYIPLSEFDTHSK